MVVVSSMSSRTTIQKVKKELGFKKRTRLRRRGETEQVVFYQTGVMKRGLRNYKVTQRLQSIYSRIDVSSGMEDRRITTYFSPVDSNLPQLVRLDEENWS